MRTIALVSAAVIVSVMACKEESGNAPAASAAPSAAPPPIAAAPSTAPAVASAAEPAGPTVPVAEDFEAEAKKTVTADTLNAQLDKLEKTIASAPAK